MWINTQSTKKRQLYSDLKLIEQKKKHAQERSKQWKQRNKKPILCTQCKLSMDRDMAKAQIENKRENAPICMACIMGSGRKRAKHLQNNFNF